MIHKVLQRKEFQEQPPLLIDIGASGKIHSIWKKLAKYSICIAFDADERDFGYITDESGNYLKLHTFNCIVSDQEEATESDFYLTQSPHCSSLLPPDQDAVANMEFAEKFKVRKVVKIKTTTLPKVLQELKVDYVDWFKTDSQGIDLRLFKSLGEAIYSKVISAEFEPGVMDSYQGEDKLHKILSFMDSTNKFWAAEIIIKGSPRVVPSALGNMFKNSFLYKLGKFSLKPSAGWAEITYLNKFNPDNQFSLRDYLLAWVFATVQQQHGFALYIVEQGKTKFDDSMWTSLEKYSRKKIKQNIFQLKFMPAVKIKINQLLGRS